MNFRWLFDPLSSIRAYVPALEYRERESALPLAALGLERVSTIAAGATFRSRAVRSMSARGTR